MAHARAILHAPLYPLFFALAPVVSLYAVNRMLLSGLDTLRPAAVAILVALAVVAASRLVSKSIRSSAILGSFLLLCVFIYGYVFRFVSLTFGIEIGDKYVLSIWLLLMASLYVFLVLTLRRTQSTLHRITAVFNIMGVVFVLMAAMPLILASTPSYPPLPTLDAESAAKDPATGESPAGPLDPIQQSKIFPDVYYLILDGYARGDVLNSRFDFDNSGFLDWLEANGFFVGHLSHSNYAWTHLSLSATFNFDYLQALLPDGLKSQGPEEHRARFQFLARALQKHFIANSRVFRYFSNRGYRIMTNRSRYRLKRRKAAASASEKLSDLMKEIEDAFSSSMSDFEEALINNTIAQPFLSSFRSVEDIKAVRLSRYDRVLGELEGFGNAASEDGPKFVFYHVLSPHQPFSFDEDGEMVPRHPVYEVSAWFEDRVKVPGYLAWAKENYPRNVAGLNVHVKRVIKRVLDETEGKAIVIVQSDHGSGYGFDSRSADKTDVVERFGILNAIFLPADLPRHGLEDSMSSVNTFRVILQNAFGEDLSALENQAYYSTGDLNFEDVTQRVVNSN